MNCSPFEVLIPALLVGFGTSKTNTMSYKHKIPLLLKAVFILLLTTALTYWTYIAVSKYVKQPTATFIDYTKGDDDAKIVYPHLTFCPFLFVKHDQYLKHCRGDTTDFALAILNCLKNDPSFIVDDYLRNVSIDLNEFVHFAHLTVDHKKVMDLKDFFYIKYHKKYGRCIGFDSERMDIDVQDSLFKLYLHFNRTVLSNTWIMVSLHTQYDSPDAFSIHPMIWLEGGISSKPTQIDVNLKKSCISRDPTNSSPCGELNVKTCQEIDAYQRIIAKLNCKVPFLYTGPHLEEYIPKFRYLPDCESKKQLIEALEIFMTNDEHCPGTKPCSTIMFDMAVERFENDGFTLGIAYTNLEVEHITTYISYDLQNLICELGGLLGMTLGFSGVSLAYHLADSIKVFF